MTQHTTRRRGHPLTGILNLLSSVRLGISLMAAIVIYAAIGSAWPAFRQAFELTEFQFFNHWLFFALIALLCTSVTVVTLRRIHFDVKNLGVLTVHAGVLVLCAGAVVYFSQRIEGDVLLSAPTIRIVHIGSTQGGLVLGELVAVENEVWQKDAPVLGGRHRIEVTQVRHEGATPAVNVTLSVSVPDQPDRAVELTQTGSGRGGPAYAQIGDQLGVVLIPAPATDIFYDDTTPMLLVSRGGGSPRGYALPTLPFYNERFVDRTSPHSADKGNDSPILDTQGRPVRSERIKSLPIVEHWRMPIPLIGADSPTAKDWGLTLEVDAYLPYAELRPAPVVIPLNRRRSLMDVRRQQSLVRVHAQTLDASWSQHIWVPFSHYNTAGDGTEPTVLRDIPGIGELSLIYGRAARKLPAALSLESLVTTYYPGRNQPDSWTSYFRYDDPQSGEAFRGKTFLNNTFTIGNWTLFQSGAASNGKAWTVLGVGNRRGVMPMLLGTGLIALGMLYAFTVKPIIKRRRKRQTEQAAAQHAAASRPIAPCDSPTGSPFGASKTHVVPLLALISTLLAATAVDATAQTASPTGVDRLLEIQDQIDVETLGSLALLDRSANRFSTVDSWARDAMRNTYGPDAFHGLDPVVAAIELMTNPQAYHDEPVIYVKDKGILRDLTKHPIEVSDDDRRGMFKSRRVSYTFLTSPAVSQRLDEIRSDILKNNAMRRLDNARFHYENLPALFTIIPNPKGRRDAPWSSVLSLVDPQSTAEAGLTPEQAGEILVTFRAFFNAWSDREPEAINAAIARLDALMPTLAASGTYPTLAERRAELKYRRADMIFWAWLAYIFCFFIAVIAVATRYRWLRGVGLALLMAAIAVHGYDIWLRWGVLGRVPVANMYEAIVFSTWCGAVFGLLLELLSKKRVYLLAAGLLGFFALALPVVIPDKINNNLQSMMPILDDVMLRIHTVLIIASYAVITLAYGVANCCLVVFAFRNKRPLAQGTLGAQAGAILCLVSIKCGLFDEATTSTILLAFSAALVAGVLLTIALFSLFNRRDGFATLDAQSATSSKPGELLLEFDRCHRTLLYTSMIALFVGVVLGAVWADYSWGRPWGWDPKETFALNTWLIYAILIHARFVTKAPVLWMSVLSVVGFAAMQFNWWVVNFYIVGLHSYA
jgi:cytochrome c-type biogenesis protein CcsB